MTAPGSDRVASCVVMGGGDGGYRVRELALPVSPHIRTRTRLNSTDVELTRVAVADQRGNTLGPDILVLCLFLLSIALLSQLGGGSLLDLLLRRVVAASITACGLCKLLQVRGGLWHPTTN